MENDCAGACLDILYIYINWYWSWIWVNLSGPANFWLQIIDFFSASLGCWFATNGYSCALKMVMTCNVWWILGLKQRSESFFFPPQKQVISQKKTPEHGCCESSSAILLVAVHTFKHTEKTIWNSRWTAKHVKGILEGLPELFLKHIDSHWPHSEAAWCKKLSSFWAWRQMRFGETSVLG